MASAGRIKAALFIIVLLYMDGVLSYPHKRATGGVPHLLHDLFTDGQRRQTAEAQLIANTTLSSTSGLPQITDLLEMHNRLLVNLTITLDNRINKMGSSLATLTKGLQLTAGDCSDIAFQGPYSSGTYVITPWDDSGYQGAFKVYCDMDTEGVGWTVFQKRFDGSVDFYRDWEDYKTGFGNLHGEYWLGLEKLNRLTSGKLSWQLRVELEDFDGNIVYAQYDNFGIGDESTNFQLTVSGYSGTAGDSLALHANSAFSTKDSDNDLISTNCAVSYEGAWWYTSGCHASNLNGLYVGSAAINAHGMVWYYWKNSNTVVKKSLMKIRPVP